MQTQRSTKVLDMVQNANGVWTWEKSSIHRHNGYWWFTDKTGQRVGPYLTQQSAISALINYEKCVNNA